MPQLPKLSYVLLSHNREKYIRAAVESAFAQDYEGELEYIFSDDCSTDRTFEIIQECVAAYKGNRRVVVTQPSSNLKTAGNFNHALSHVQSDWVVRADDDDISAVDRCSLIGRVIRNVPDCTYIATDASKRFTDGGERAALEESRVPCSASMQAKLADIRKTSLEECSFRHNLYSFKAWSMRAIRKFGEIPAEAHLADDYILFFRASMLGTGVLVDNAPAVLIRDNSLNQSLGKEDGRLSYAAIIRRERFFDTYQNCTYGPLKHTCDQLLAYSLQLPPQERSAAAPFLAALEKEVKQMGLLRSFWRKGCINRIRISRKLGWRRPYDMLRCLPMPAFAACSIILRKISK